MQARVVAANVTQGAKLDADLAQPHMPYPKFIRTSNCTRTEEVVGQFEIHDGVYVSDGRSGPN